MKITIDPGSEGTGYAIWTDSWKLWKHGVFEANLPYWELKCNNIIVELMNTVRYFNVSQAYIEIPAFHQSPGGMTVARSGSLVKLTLLVGRIQQVLSAIEVYPVTVQEWKGQLPKAVVIERIKKIIPNCKATTHDWDAIGIGLYKSGRL